MPAVLLIMLNRTAACFAILLMALFSGCADLEREPIETEPPVPTYGVRAPEGVLRDACEDAAHRWEIASGLVFSCNSGRSLNVVDCDDAAAYGGWSSENGITVCDFMLDRLDITLTHEIGHQFAHSHPKNGSLMCWKPVDDAAPISAEDLEWVCSQADCTWFQPEGYALAPCSPQP